MTQLSAAKEMTRRHRRSECWPTQPPVITNHHFDTINSTTTPHRDSSSFHVNQTRIINRNQNNNHNANKMEHSSSFRQLTTTTTSTITDDTVNRCRLRKKRYADEYYSSNKSWPIRESLRHNSISNNKDDNDNKLNCWSLLSAHCSSDNIHKTLSRHYHSQDNNEDNKCQQQQKSYLCHEKGRPIGCTLTENMRDNHDKIQTVFHLPLRQVAANLFKKSFKFNQQRLNTQNLLVILFGIVVLIGATCVPIDGHVAATASNNNNNNNNNNDNSNNNHITRNQLVEVHEYNDAIITPFIQPDGRFGGALLGTSQHDDIKKIVGSETRRVDRHADESIERAVRTPLNSNDDANGPVVFDEAASRFIVTTTKNDLANGQLAAFNNGPQYSPQMTANSDNNNNQLMASSVAETGNSINLLPGQQIQLDLNPMQSMRQPATNGQSFQGDYRSLFMPAFIAGSVAASGGGSVGGVSNNVNMQQQQQLSTIPTNAQQMTQPVSSTIMAPGQMSPSSAMSTSSALSNGQMVEQSVSGTSPIGAAETEESMMAAGSHKHKKMKKKKEKKHKEWKKGKKHKKKKYESKKKKGGAMKKKKGN